MQPTPSLHALHPERLRPPGGAEPAPTDAPEYTGAPWTLIFEETGMTGPVGPRICIEIRLGNRARGYADASDGSQYKLLDALTDKFDAVFQAELELRWQQGERGWRVLCSDHTMSFGQWKYYADLGNRTLPSDRMSWIPGLTSGEFLKRAFADRAPGGPITLAEQDYGWSQGNGPQQQGSRTTWKLGEPKFLQSLVGNLVRRFMGNNPQ